MNRYRKLLLFNKLLLLLFIIGTECNASIPPLANPIARSGILDLRKADFNSNSTLLKGEWKFFWNSFQNPAHTDDHFEYTEFPKLWKESLWQNHAISSQGFASYQITILLPKSNEQLALKIPEVYSAYNLFVNNKLIAKNGKPGISKATEVPYWSNQVKPLNTTSDTLNLVLHISNFHHSKGGPIKNIEIGLLSKLQTESNLIHAYNYFLTGCIFMGGFFFMGLYLFGRHDKSILYFALFCLFYSYRILGSREYTIHSMFPDLSWEFSIYCEYLSLFLAVTMFTLYTRHLYPRDTPQKLLSVMAGICMAFVLITVVTSPILFTRLIDPFIIVVISYIAFAAVIYWKAFRNKRIGASYALMSTAAIFIIILSVIVEYYGIATPFDLIVFLGYLVFFFCQSLILTFRFAYSLKKAKEEAELGLKVKSEFLSTMSHEIRTPLNSVIGTTHLIMREVPRPDQKEHLDVLLFSANNLLNIVNDVLDFSALEEGKIRFANEPMDISKIARNIVLGYKAAANNARINFLLELDEDIPAQISGDSTRTSQIIGNLVHNAIKFTHTGFVKLSVKEISRSDHEINLKISVEDTGIGIPLSKQKMIFERFTQVDSSTSRGFSGTGLGLAISKRILELQGIDLHLESEPDKGSVFYFTQTFKILQQQKTKNTAISENEDNYPLENVEILIVEDNPMNVLVLQNFLKRWGAKSDVAQNGLQALEKLDSSRHQIVLMDLHMPVMDGYEATKGIRSRGENIPIIALTASVALDVENQIFGIGIDDIVVKPFMPDDLLRVILNHVRPA